MHIQFETDSRKFVEGRHSSFDSLLNFDCNEYVDSFFNTFKIDINLTT